MKSQPQPQPQPPRSLLKAQNGIPTTNGIPTKNGIPTTNGNPTKNGIPTTNGNPTKNGIPTTNGNPTKNGLNAMNGKGLPLNDGSAGGGGWNTFLVPSHFSADKIGANWIDPDLLGPLGVGNLAKVPGIVENALDNRHISEDLLLELCFSDNGGNANEGMSFREYFKLLVEIAWPRNAKLNILCSQPAGVNANATDVCLQPDFVFTCEPEELHGADFQPLALAPHFLTEKFEHGQQEALTAVLIAKYNTVGQHLVMDLLGHFNLGAAGTRFIGGREPGFTYYLGSSWGNAFLDCGGADEEDALCKSSSESYGFIGRDMMYHGIPMFSCSGGSGYPTHESGKGCFSTDMATNTADGCDLVASVGLCERMCVGGLCDANYPPELNRTTSNVLYVYMSEYHGSSSASSTSNETLALAIAVPVAVLVLGLAALWLWKRQKARKAKNAAASSSSLASPAADKGSVQSDEEVATDKSFTE